MDEEGATKEKKEALADDESGVLVDGDGNTTMTT